MSDRYATITERVRSLDPFTGNSMSGRRHPNGRYSVYSYQTEILSVDEAGHVTRFDNRYYSTTTSRHQGIIRDAFPNITHGHKARVVYDHPSEPRGREE